MSNIVNVNGFNVPFEAAVSLMDDDIRETIHSRQLWDYTPQEFINIYCGIHWDIFHEEFIVN